MRPGRTVMKGRDAVVPGLARSGAVEPTHWHAVFLSALIPLIIAGSFVYAARNPPWEDEGPAWLYGLFALLPLELVRAMVLWILGETFAKWQNARQALRELMISLAVLAVFVLIGALSIFKVRELLVLLASLDTWKILLPTAALIIADAVIAVAFFAGDPRRAGARLQAAGDDTADLLFLMIYPTPIVVAGVYGALLFARTHGVALAAWVPDVDADSLRALALYLAAGYFVLKAVMLGWVYTSRFNQDGRRLLARRWVVFLLNKAENRERAWFDEDAKLRRRRKLLAGEAPP